MIGMCSLARWAVTPMQKLFYERCLLPDPAQFLPSPRSVFEIVWDRAPPQGLLSGEVFVDGSGFSNIGRERPGLVLESPK